MNFSDFDKLMMRRALGLAENGRGRVSPNPMVGAVITVGERVIGEGWHRRWGGPHAEVNAVNSVAEEDRCLLPEATVYVTLEPCSHFGKTPPCADLLARCGVKRVVVATPDPFAKVSGRGIRKLRDAGIQVDVGLYDKEARQLNLRFMTAHTLRRPFIQLKWAQSADGFMAGESPDDRILFSTPMTSVWMHRERAVADAIMVGTNTVVLDNPRLDCRLWPGRTPAAATFESTRIPRDAHILDGRTVVLKKPEESLREFTARMYSDFGITSLMVEGGADTLRQFVDERLYDEIRVETAPFIQGKGVKAPRIDDSGLHLADIFECGENKIAVFRE